MNIQDLNRITHILREINTLDEQIKKISDTAIIVAEQESVSSFEMKVLDIERQKMSNKKSVLNSDGDLVLDDREVNDPIYSGSYDELQEQLKAMYKRFSVPMVTASQRKPSHIIKLSEFMTPSETLMVLDILIKSKNAQRDGKIDVLREMGVNVKGKNPST